MSFTHRIIQWIKTDESWLARWLFRTFKAIRLMEIPKIPLLFAGLYRLHKLVTNMTSALLRIAYWTPLFKSRIETNANQLYLYGGLPFTSGPLRIRIGKQCRISGQTTLSARSISQQPPLLEVGNNVDIGWQTTIAVGSRVVLGNNVRMAGRNFLAGYPGHPLDAERRAAGLPDDDEQIGDIILEDDVWLSTGAFVMAGVTIGKGSIVAAGSVVTRDIPPYSLAAGVPAVVKKSLRPVVGNSIKQAREVECV